MRTYERPTLTRVGSFVSKTGFLGTSGNDRIILEKN
jgi:hypothetical protein